MREMVYIGLFKGISKKNGKPFYMCYFYSSDDNVIGYRSYSFFIDESIYSTLNGLNPLSRVKADVRYINGSNVLISVEPISK